MKAAVDKDRIFALTHNYTAYPLVRRMREMVQGGELGEIRLVQVEYRRTGWRARPRRRATDRPNGASIRSARAGGALAATSARTPSTSPTS